MKAKQKAEENEPLQDNRCVWMQAGVISYKLCSLDFRCEDCDLDKALKGRYSHMIQQGPDLMYPEVRSFTFEEIIGDEGLVHRYDYSLIRIMYNCFSSIYYSPDVQYLPSHLWLYRKESDTIRIGLDDFIGSCLDPIENVVFPIMGDYIHEEATICWVFLEDWNFRLSAPLSGRVTKVNRTALQQHPTFLQKDAYRAGWLLEMKPDQPTFSQLVAGSIGNVKQWYRQCLLDIFHGFSILLEEKLAKAGPTLPDGGKMVTRLRQMAGRDKYILLMKKLLRHN